MSELVAAPLVAFALALVVVRLLASERLAWLVPDVPNERSLHTRPTPRTGGAGLMLAVAVSAGLWRAAPAALVIPALLLAALFLIDDVRGLSVPLRFGAQLAAAIAFLAATGPYSLLLLAILAIGIGWCINLYNFMDGSNGLAGGMAVLGFGTYAVAAHMAGADDLALLAGIVAGAAAGFLVWNLDPARIFLGDAGSIPLGFLAAAIGILGWQRGAWPFWMPLLAFSPFAVDATVTLARRIARGEKPWQAHRTHYYQRMIRSGWSHRRLALVAYGLMLAAGLSALSHRTAAPGAVLMHLALWAGLYTAVAVAIDRRWRQHEVAATAAEATATRPRPQAAQ